jgi:hypothetical protein
VDAFLIGVMFAPSTIYGNGNFLFDENPVGGTGCRRQRIGVRDTRPSTFNFLAGSVRGNWQNIQGLSTKKKARGFNPGLTNSGIAIGGTISLSLSLRNQAASRFS